MDTYDVKLIQQPTGRVHNVTGHGIQPILDEQTGEPETEYVLVAEVDGHYVPLQNFGSGYVAHQVGRPDTAIDGSSSSSSADAAAAPPQQGEPEQPESPAAGQGTAGEGAAAPAPAAPAG